MPVTLIFTCGFIETDYNLIIHRSNSDLGWTQDSHSFEFVFYAFHWSSSSAFGTDMGLPDFGPTTRDKVRDVN